MAEGRKKLLILAILEILRKNTDERHRMLQADIILRLEKDYDLTATRKSVRANLADLEDAGYPLVYDNGWYYEHEFCRAELDLIIDSLMYDPNIPYAQCRALIEKIGMLGGKHYRPAHSCNLAKPSNPQMFYTVEILHDAIDARKQVSFLYGDYGIDKKLHPRTDADGDPKRYLVNPYRVVRANGRSYLICNVDKYDNAAHFRVDHIMDICRKETSAKDVRSVSGLENGLFIPEYLNTHAQMFSGKIESARLRIEKHMIGEVLDRFGMDTILEPADGDSVIAVVRSDAGSLRYWVNMFREYVQIL